MSHGGTMSYCTVPDSNVLVRYRDRYEVLIERRTGTVLYSIGTIKSWVRYATYGTVPLCTVSGIKESGTVSYCTVPNWNVQRQHPYSEYLVTPPMR